MLLIANPFLKYIFQMNVFIKTPNIVDVNTGHPLVCLKIYLIALLTFHVMLVAHSPAAVACKIE